MYNRDIKDINIQCSIIFAKALESKIFFCNCTVLLLRCVIA